MLVKTQILMYVGGTCVYFHVVSPLYYCLNMRLSNITDTTVMLCIRIKFYDLIFRAIVLFSLREAIPKATVGAIALPKAASKLMDFSFSSLIFFL